LNQIELRTFSEEEYHQFFRGYVPDPLMDDSPFVYNIEQISRSYRYNHGGYRNDYAHFGIFLDNIPVGSFQLKRIDREKKRCEFGIILQNDTYKNKGIGTRAISLGIEEARKTYGIETIIGDTMEKNTRMKRVFEKLHFSLVEIVPNAFELPDGTKESRYIYQKNIVYVEANEI